MPWPWFFGCWFKLAFSLSSFTLIKMVFSFFMLSALSMVLSAFLNLLIFFLEIFIPSCSSSNLTFSLKMYSLDVLLSQFGTSHCSMSSSNCYFLTCMQVSQESGKLHCYTDLFKYCPQFDVIHPVKFCGIVSKAEVDVFSAFLLLFLWTNQCWQLDLLLLCLFSMQLKHRNVLGLCIVEAYLGEFSALLLLSGRWPYHHCHFK